ncbi:hypothetical protein FRC00_010515 [Tulasnella sp. 408]|nr:hypothetical protein FRC00_010515 [Tulasnella sp. 408]
MGKQILIKGAGAGGQSGQPVIAPRLDAEDFVQNEKLFSLYVQALQRLYDTPESEDDSHFQISGIHGLPFLPWNGAKLDDPNDGYCKHGTTTFPTWHRPYCALFEQTLQAHAVEIAATYTSNRDDWQKAAVNFRIPFWDWARHDLPPKQFYDHDEFSQVTITHPDGSKGPVKNPLLGYQFKDGHGPDPPKEAFDPDDWPTMKEVSDWPGTVRHPTADGTFDVKSFKKALQKEPFKGLRSSTARLLLNVDNWFDFSTQQARHGRGTSTSSLETLHNAVHGRLGGDKGHMSYIPFAAFDPIFWLHHANVDRVTALWQAIHYNSWFEADEIDENTPLTPFWFESTQFWTSDGCRVPNTLKYTYADFDGLVTTDPEALSQAIRKRVKDLYVDKETFPGFPRFGRAAVNAALTQPQAPLSLAAASVPEPIAEIQADSGHHQHIEWTCRIRAKQKDLRSVASIIIFVGPVPDHSQGYDYTDDPGYAGSFVPFLNPFADYCSNCREGADNLLEAFVHMNYNLMQRGIDVNNIPAVEEYLRENLHWVIRKQSGGDARPEDIKTLEVTVIDTPLSGVGTWEHIPAAQDLRKHNEITFDRPGGRVRVPGRA